MRSLFICPLCGAALTRTDKSYTCGNGHCFDVAKEGYCNLLPVNQKNSKAPGDDKDMAAARSAFLSKGYYAPLLDTLSQLAVSTTEDTAAVLDTGCGEGYYTGGIFRALQNAGKQVHMAGTDISKFILRRAAKREKGIEFAVASSYHLPIATQSIDLLVNCFSPLALEEFRRTLKPNGALLYVVPSKMHLWELKEVLYDAPYPNDTKPTPYDGFVYQDIRHVEKMIHLSCAEDIQALFGMTPYRWKTPRKGIERLSGLNAMDCRISFDIHTFRRIMD